MVEVVSFLVSAPERPEDMIEADAATVEITLDCAEDINAAQKILQSAFADIWVRDDISVLASTGLEELLRNG